MMITFTNYYCKLCTTERVVSVVPVNHTLVLSGSLKLTILVFFVF